MKHFGKYKIETLREEIGATSPNKVGIGFGRIISRELTPSVCDTQQESYISVPPVPAARGYLNLGRPSRTQYCDRRSNVSRFAPLSHIRLVPLLSDRRFYAHYLETRTHFIQCLPSQMNAIPHCYLVRLI